MEQTLTKDNLKTYPLQNKNVTVLGMGKSGRSAANLLTRKGAKVLLLDDQTKKTLLGLAQSIRIELGPWSEKTLITSDLIVLSPGVPVSKLPMAALHQKNIPVISEIELAASLITAPIIGITGTNGKSTTTTLVGEILKHWGLNVFVGGNLGLPLSEAVSSDWDFVVAELSSFQLETIHHFHPRIAALLNITPDHLDRYPDFASYQHTKWRIFENQEAQDHAIINLDDSLTLCPAIQEKGIAISKKQTLSRGVYLQDGMIKTSIWGEAEEIVKLEALQMGTRFHIENSLAACAITQLCGCGVEGISEGLKRFKGLPHRMEFVRSIAGVAYINDSKGTNTGAMMRALERLKTPVILIAGGRDKAADFAPLRKLVQEHVKYLILIGEAKTKMADCFSDHMAVESIAASDGKEAMEEAVFRASAVAKSGETVLLSPGCASFDLFDDYEDRGATFKEMVNKLS